MISASSLVRHCRYANVLKAGRATTPAQQASLDAGTRFHAAVEEWLHTGVLPALDDPEVQGWVDMLAAAWSPPLGAEAEVAWGLTLFGYYIDVTEPEPHKYAATSGAPLLTAGRADLAFERHGVLYVVDWKTGRWPVTPAVDNLQVNAAGIALAQKFGATSYVPAIGYVRDGHVEFGDEVPLGSAACERMFNEVVAAAALDELPHPGDWCGRCWERKVCPQAA